MYIAIISFRTQEDYDSYYITYGKMWDVLGVTTRAGHYAMASGDEHVYAHIGGYHEIPCLLQAVAGNIYFLGRKWVLTLGSQRGDVQPPGEYIGEMHVDTSFLGKVPVHHIGG